jgi:hypothetical protein
MSPCAEQLGIPGANSRRSRIERVAERRRARDAPAHSRPTEVRISAQAHQPAGHARPFRSDRQAPRRGKVERSRVAPQFANYCRESGASYALLHRPQRIARIASFDVNDIGCWQPRRMNPSAFEDCHPILDPEEGFVGSRLREQEARPARIARMRREKLGQGRLRGLGQMPVAERTYGFAGLGACIRRSTAVTPSEDSSAGDQRQASCHTTHNVSVLLLFLSRDSMARVNPATRQAHLSL